MADVITYCSANCQYNSGDGYYNSCKHPSKQNQVPYAGIDRYYVSGCKLKENNTHTPKEENISGNENSKLLPQIL